MYFFLATSTFCETVQAVTPVIYRLLVQHFSSSSNSSSFVFYSSVSICKICILVAQLGLYIKQKQKQQNCIQYIAVRWRKKQLQKTNEKSVWKGKQVSNDDECNTELVI